MRKASSILARCPRRRQVPSVAQREVMAGKGAAIATGGISVTAEDLSRGPVNLRFEKVVGEPSALKLDDLDHSSWSIWKQPRGKAQHFLRKVRGRPQESDLQTWFHSGTFRLVPHHPESDKLLEDLEIWTNIGEDRAELATEYDMAGTAQNNGSAVDPMFRGLYAAGPLSPADEENHQANERIRLELQLEEQRLANRRQERQWQQEDQKAADEKAEREQAKKDARDQTQRMEQQRRDDDQRREEQRREDQKAAESRQSRWFELLAPALANLVQPKPTDLNSTLLQIAMGNQSKPQADALATVREVMQIAGSQARQMAEVAALAKPDDDPLREIAQAAGEFMRVKNGGAPKPADGAAAGENIASTIADLVQDPQAVAQIVQSNPDATITGFLAACEQNPNFKRMFEEKWRQKGQSKTK